MVHTAFLNHPKARRRISIVGLSNDPPRPSPFSFQIRKDLVNACSKISPSASKVFWAGGGIATFPKFDRSNRSRRNILQARTGSALTIPIHQARLGSPLE